MNTSHQRVAPGPSFLECFGYSKQVRHSYLDFFDSIHKKYGNSVRLNFFRDVSYFFHPDAAQHILKEASKNYVKSDNFVQMEPLLGKGLVTNEGESWRKQRRLIAPEFHMKTIQRFGSSITDRANALADSWAARIKTDPILDISPEMMRLTFEVAADSFFGAEIGNRAHEVAEALVLTSDQIIRRVISIMRIPRKVPLPSHLRKKSDPAT